MAAESPRRGSRGGGCVVRPQSVSDRTVIESVVDFIQDVAYSQSTSKPDDKEKIQWVRFEQADINDLNSNPDFNAHRGSVAPVLLVIGYTNGVQIWSIPVSGEAHEVLSLRQGPVKILRLLPNPEPSFSQPDIHRSKRPLMAICDASSAGRPYYGVKFVSLRTGDEVHNIPCSNAVADVRCNERVVVIAFKEELAVFDACQFKRRFWISSCYPSTGPNVNPIALGHRWLAFADKHLVPVHQSCGGMTGDGAQSYVATVISAAKTITKGLTMFGETVASSLTGTKPHHSTTKKEHTGLDRNGWKPGIVTVIDILKVREGEVSVQDDAEGDGLVAHFPAHATEPVSAMAFDPSGILLLTADRLGHNFHLFKLMAHPWSCSLGAVHHLYTFYRGDTTAKVQDIAFTLDSRWVAISSLRGTTHIFPMTTYGGAVNVRTHTSQRVVNKASRFHRSAGLEDMERRPSGRDSPVHISGSPGSSPGGQEHYRHIMHQNVVNNNMGNPRLPPYPHSTTVYPVLKIRQTLSFPGLGTPGKTCGPGKNPGPSGSSTDITCVATCFARSRGWVAGSPSVSREKPDDLRAVDSLYVVTSDGTMIEYVLDPHGKKGTSDKVTHDSPLELTETARAQWGLARSINTPELKPPLSSGNSLIMATEAVLSQKSTDEFSEVENPVTRHESRESLSSDHSGSRDEDEQWLSQVEMITHAGPHRRLWMGPQFAFKTFQGSGTTVLSSHSSVLMSQTPEQQVSAIDLAREEVDLQSLKITPGRSSPVAMPGVRQVRQRMSSGGSDPSPSPVPLLIEAGSYDQSPYLEPYSSWQEPHPLLTTEEVSGDQIRELAEAMEDTPACRQNPSLANREVLDRVSGLSAENLSTSSGSTSSAAARGLSYDARSSPPLTMEHVLVMPGDSGSPDSN